MGGVIRSMRNGPASLGMLKGSRYFLSEIDRDLVMSISCEFGRISHAEDFITAGLSILPKLVKCDDLSFVGVDCTTDPVRLRWHPVHSFPSLPAREMAAVLRSHPIVAALAGGAASWPVRVSDVIDVDDFTRTHAYRVLLAPRALRHQMVLPLVVAAHGQAGEALAFSRADRDFGHRDLALAAAVQPVLTALHLARGAGAERSETVEASGDEPESDHGLTHREREVLVHLSSGMTAVAVGRLLSISSRTVNKHAENVYAKLRVHNRQEAINVCRRLGMMDPSRSAPRAQAKSR
ncbi:MAG: hypothetical protein QOG53_7 [Frankiales bacterium]|nr:hypothetical protein [Frankiales bacterium]